MNLLITSFIVLVLSALILLLKDSSKNFNTFVFLSSLFVACILFSIPAINCLISKQNFEFYLPIFMPIGFFYIGIDYLSAFFMLSIALLFSVCGLYSVGYLNSSPLRKTSLHFAFYQLLLLSLLLVVTSKDAILFLISWELMTISAFFLIIFNDEKLNVRNAGYLYLIGTHAGTFFILTAFIIMSKFSGTFNFNEMINTVFPAKINGFIFSFALIGFGVKAGIIPFHIWLPYAHPAAPSHISAILSGVLIKTGIYGILRFIFIIKHLPEWCSFTVIIIGIISSVIGVLYALGQHEIKKLLAYHSIENIGIIMLGIGIGLWGQCQSHNIISILGYSSALLHVFNHAVFKGLLFLSAGSLIQFTKTGEIDRLGGLIKYLPYTGHLFLIGSLSICGLPFFNGFISEWLLYNSLFKGILNSSFSVLILQTLTIVSLTLIGGLAAACFAKAFGSIFLGVPRNNQIYSDNNESFILFIPMIILGSFCIWIGLFPKTMVSISLNVAEYFYGTSLTMLEKNSIISPIKDVIAFLTIIIAIMLVLLFTKSYFVRKLTVTKSKTWSCGYSAINSRMQYTASSFAQPILNVFRNVIGYKTKGTKIEGYFPNDTKASSSVEDSSETRLFKPLYNLISYSASKLKCIQYGYTQLYLLYFLIFLLGLLLWQMN